MTQELKLIIILGFILKILNDDKFADYISKSAINSAKKYDWKDTSEKLNLLYQELKLR